MKEEKKWKYDFYSQRNSVFEKQEEIGNEKWEREEVYRAEKNKRNSRLEDRQAQQFKR